MRRSALAVLAWLGAASALAFGGCGDGDPTMADDAGGGFAGEAAGGADSGTGGARGGSNSGRGGIGANGGDGANGGAPGGDGGEPSSGGGGGTTATGGSATTTGGRGGETGGMGGEGGAGTSGGGGAAGAEPPPPPICDRILPLQRQFRADNVAHALALAVLRDCRVSWFTSLYDPPVDELHIYYNDVARLTMVLWGCRDEEPAGFKLVYGTVTLSSEEVDVFINHYLAGMQIEIAVSGVEVEWLRSELERLAEPRIDPSLDGFSRSTCADGGTGEGG